MAERLFMIAWREPPGALRRLRLGEAESFFDLPGDHVVQFFYAQGQLVAHVVALSADQPDPARALPVATLFGTEALALLTKLRRHAARPT